jgi:cytoskeletal protein CcmA (bactofilin family)
LRIVGELRSTDDLLIEGEVRGTVHVPTATVTVGKDARVDADIRAQRIEIHGQVRGAISATERIEIAASGSVTGSLSADYVVIVEGAVVNGHVDMNRRTIASRVARHHATRTETVSAS